MNLTNLIEAKDIKLGNTQPGAAWCMKALNPAHPSSIEGIPDASSLPRVVKHFERTVTLTVGSSQGLTPVTWDTDVIMHPNPWCIAAWQVLTRFGDGTTLAQNGPILNTQLGALDSDIQDYLFQNVEAYRVCYASMTAVQDATSLTNSGLVAATQYVWTPTQASAYHGVSGRLCAKPFDVWADAPKPYDQMIQVPGAYVGVAKEGVYVPLRIDCEHEWKYTNNRNRHINTNDAVAAAWNVWDTVESLVPASSAAGWPFGMPSALSGDGYKRLTFPNSQRTIGHFSMRNLDAKAAIRVTYRICFEFLVTPGTPFSPDMHVPPPYDPLALEAYKAISTKLNMAYPAAFNDWQKILRTISSVAQTVVPMLPGGQVLKTIIPALERGIQAVGQKIENKVKANQQQKKAASRQSKTTPLLVMKPPAPAPIRLVNTRVAGRGGRRALMIQRQRR